MTPFANNHTCRRLWIAWEDEGDLVAVQQLLLHFATCGRCREAEAELNTLLQRYHDEAPELSPCLMRRMLAACIDAMRQVDAAGQTRRDNDEQLDHPG
jgi:hypothetical protein